MADADKVQQNPERQARFRLRRIAVVDVPDGVVDFVLVLLTAVSADEVQVFVGRAGGSRQSITSLPFSASDT